MSKNQTPERSIYEAKHFPLFSVITVTLNNFTGLKATRESLEKQEFDDYEWIVIDGASTDETVEFLRALRSNSRTDLNPFQFVSEKDNGLYDAMNTGINMAKGHYILFLNAGDTLSAPKSLSAIAKSCDEKPDFIYTDALEQTKNGRKPVMKTARSHQDIKWGMFTHHQAMFYRRHILRDKHLRYSLRYRIASDYDLTAKYLRECKKIHYINKPICIFEAGGISQRNANLGRIEQYRIREELEIVPIAENLWILLVQTLAWQLKTRCPPLYNLLKPAGNRLASTLSIQEPDEH